MREAIVDVYSRAIAEAIASKESAKCLALLEGARDELLEYLKPKHEARKPHPNCMAGR